MIYLEDINRFTKTFFKSFDFVAKHNISLSNYAEVDSNYGSGKKEISKSPVFTYDITDKRVHETKKGVLLTSKDYITLSGVNKSLNKDGVFVNIYPGDFNKVLEILDTAMDWLCKEEYEKLFLTDQNGNTVGVADNNEVVIARFRYSWLMMKPAVVFDLKGVGYQGIFIKTENGVLGSLTGSEFSEFHKYMKEILTNFYQASLSLYNAGILSLILQKE